MSSYQFAIKVTAEGDPDPAIGDQIYWPSIGGDYMFKLNVACGPNSAAISEVNWP